MNVREQKVADSNVLSEASVQSTLQLPMKSWFNMNGVVSDAESVYSPGRRRKKKARTIMSAVHCVSTLLPAREMTMI